MTAEKKAEEISAQYAPEDCFTENPRAGEEGEPNYVPIPGVVLPKSKNQSEAHLYGSPPSVVRTHLGDHMPGTPYAALSNPDE